MTFSSSAGGGSSRRSVSGSPLDVLVLSGSSRRFDSGSLLVFVVFFCFDAPFCVERGLARSRFFSFKISRCRTLLLVSLALLGPCKVALGYSETLLRLRSLVFELT